MAKDYSEDQLIQKSSAEARDRLLPRLIVGESNN